MIILLSSGMKDKPIIREYVLTRHVAELFPSLDKKESRFYKVVLPVTTKCFSKCIFCGTLDMACNISKKQLSNTITPKEAIKIAKQIHSKNTLLEIGGYGDPLYNEETFQTLRLLIVEDINIPTFITTNGLLVHNMIDDILSVSIETVKIIINSFDPNIGNKLVKSINYRGNKVRGLDSAFLFQEMQVQGIIGLLKKNIKVVAQTVIFPGINDQHIVEIVDTLNLLGVKYIDLRLSRTDPDSIQIYTKIKSEIKDKIFPVHF